MKRTKRNQLILLVVLLAIGVAITLPNRFVGVVAKTSTGWLTSEKPNELAKVDALITSPALPDGSLDLTFDSENVCQLSIEGVCP